MSVLDFLTPSSDGNTENNTPTQYKNTCCMKFTVKSMCKRCPFRQIENPKDIQEAVFSCMDKRRGKYQYNKPKTQEEITIEYNNQYR